MELYKSCYAQRGNGINKFKLNCDTDKDKWLNLIKILYKNNNNNAVIIEGLYNNTKNIILKVGIQNFIEKEFAIAKELQNLPCFIRYYCIFVCNDSIMNIINNEHMISNYNLCNYGNKPIGILAMNYYKNKSVGEYEWNKHNFDILKNVLRQIIYACFLAYNEKGFIHGDLHPHNILLKTKSKNEITFGIVKLKINTFEVRIMDFEKSKINVVNDNIYFIKNIQKLMDNLCSMLLFKMNIDYDRKQLKKLQHDDNIDYIKLNNVIETLQIDDE
jgi:serine/threonine protein kinase